MYYVSFIHYVFHSFIMFYKTRDQIKRRGMKLSKNYCTIFGHSFIPFWVQNCNFRQSQANTALLWSLCLMPYSLTNLCGISVHFMRNDPPPQALEERCRIERGHAPCPPPLHRDFMHEFSDSYSHSHDSYVHRWAQFSRKIALFNAIILAQLEFVKRLGMAFSIKFSVKHVQIDGIEAAHIIT